MVLLDVMDNGNGNQIADTHLTAQEESDLGAADVVLNELLDDVDVVFPALQGSQSFVNIGATAIDNEGLGRK